MYGVAKKYLPMDKHERKVGPENYIRNTFENSFFASYGLHYFV